MSDDLRYPVGKFQFPDSLSDSERETLLQQITCDQVPLLSSTTITSIVPGPSFKSPWSMPGGSLSSQ